MSSPPSGSWLQEENDRDFKKISVWIQSVDESKPLGKLVAHYAKQKYREGWWKGWGWGLLSGAILGGSIGVFMKRT